MNNLQSIIEKYLEHNCEKTGDKIFNRKKLSNLLKRKAIDDPSDRPYLGMFDSDLILEKIDSFIPRIDFLILCYSIFMRIDS